MLVTLVFLLVCLLGLVLSMRDGLVSTQLAGNNLSRQRDVQVADVALRTLESQIAPFSSQPLQLSAASQPWYRDVAATTAPPSASYWAGCAGNADATARCAALTVAVNGNPLGYTAYGVVQPTARSDSNACGNTGVSSAGTSVGVTAVYYDIYIHVAESNNATGINTETVYRLCASS